LSKTLRNDHDEMTMTKKERSDQITNVVSK